MSRTIESCRNRSCSISWIVHATGDAVRDYGATRLGFVPVGAYLPLYAELPVSRHFAQIGFEAANVEASEDCLDAVDDPCTLADEIVSFTFRTAGLLLLQPAKKGARQQFDIEAIRLGAPMFTENPNARWDV
ncbi:hypothetical protein AJ88_37345 [Mesorhizobium amorphae CCBAU 01583]|nr:hypothetical protein AJ88_37345 [Mesorhizobium amorphae CCBAU 01583]